jgi:hypothetical protein
LLRQKSIFNEENIKTPLAALSEECPAQEDENDVDVICEEEKPDDSEVELRASTTDESDTDDDNRKTVLIEECVGWNVSTFFLYLLFKNSGFFQ